MLNLESMIEINYDKYYKQAQNVIKHWNKRLITTIGRITIIKTFVLK